MVLCSGIFSPWKSALEELLSKSNFGINVASVTLDFVLFEIGLAIIFFGEYFQSVPWTPIILVLTFLFLFRHSSGEKNTVTLAVFLSRICSICILIFSCADFNNSSSFSKLPLRIFKLSHSFTRPSSKWSCFPDLSLCLRRRKE